MNSKKDNNKKQSLIEQISTAIADEIRQGRLRAGEKLPGERKLSQRFNASRGTVTDALNLLTRRNLIERVPQSGSYVLKKYRRFALVFPGDYASLSHTFNLENWQIVSEIFRGALEEAVSNDAEAVLVCFEDDTDKVKLQNQVRRLRSFDAVFFLTYCQLTALRRCLQRENIPFTRLFDIRDEFADNEILSRQDTEYNFLLMCRRIKEKAYQNVIILTSSMSNDSKNEKVALFKQFVLQNGLNVTEKDCESVTVGFLSSLKAGKDIIYCENTEFVPELYRMSVANSLIPGKSFGLTAYASGLTFMNLIPSLSYLKINHHLIGVHAIRKLNDILDGKSPDPHYVRGDFIEGETV